MAGERRILEQQVITRKERRLIPTGILDIEYVGDGPVTMIDGMLHVEAERVLTATILNVTREEWYREQCAMSCGCGACVMVADQQDTYSVDRGQVRMLCYSEQRGRGEWAAHSPWLGLTAYGSTQRETEDALERVMRQEWALGRRPAYGEPSLFSVTLGEE